MNYFHKKLCLRCLMFSGYASACLHWEKCLWWCYWLSSWKKVELLFQSLCHFYLAKVIICSYTDNCETNEQLPNTFWKTKYECAVPQCQQDQIQNQRDQWTWSAGNLLFFLAQSFRLYVPNVKRKLLIIK